MRLLGYDISRSQAPRVYIIIKMPKRVGIGPELGRCILQRAGSDTIPTRYGIIYEGLRKLHVP